MKWDQRSASSGSESSVASYGNVMGEALRRGGHTDGGGGIGGPDGGGKDARCSRGLRRNLQAVSAISVELAVLCVLIPLGLLIVSSVWFDTSSHTRWIEASCAIESLQIQHHPMHASRGVYHLLQPAWRAEVTINNDAPTAPPTAAPDDATADGLADSAPR